MVSRMVSPRFIPWFFLGAASFSVFAGIVGLVTGHLWLPLSTVVIASTDYVGYRWWTRAWKRVDHRRCVDSIRALEIQNYGMVMSTSLRTDNDLPSGRIGNSAADNYAMGVQAGLMSPAEAIRRMTHEEYMKQRGALLAAGHDLAAVSAERARRQQEEDDAAKKRALELEEQRASGALRQIYYNGGDGTPHVL
jgi:hypothetical protein